RHPQGARAHPASVRGLSLDPRPAHARFARARLGAECAEARPPLLVPSQRCLGALSRPAGPSRAQDSAEADARRVRRHAVDPGPRRRRGRDCDGGAGALMEARDLARRGRVADRAPRLDRGRRLALPARPPAPLGGRRGRRGPLARPRRGAEELSQNRLDTVAGTATNPGASSTAFWDKIFSCVFRASAATSGERTSLLRARMIPNPASKPSDVLKISKPPLSR